MPIPESLEPLVGEWTGSYLLVYPEHDPPELRSATTARVERVVGGKFLALSYTWSYEEKPQEGFLLLNSRKGDAAHMAWVDSWHQSPAPFVAAGTMLPDGALDVIGNYTPEYTDWRWRTVVRMTGADAFEMVMYNVTPDGEESLAVHATYTRRG